MVIGGLIVVSVLAVAGLVWFAAPGRAPLQGAPSSAAADGLPPPPDTARQSPAIRTHLEAAHRAALDGSTEAFGEYCVALHADMFYGPADRCYGIVIERSGADWQWLYYRALLRTDLGGGTDLTADLRSVVAKAPGFAPAWLRLGDAAFKAGRYDEAETAWTEASGRPEPQRPPAGPVPHHVEVPVSSYASLGLARIRLMRGDAAGARAVLDRVLAAGPAFSSAYRLLAEIEAGEGRSAEADRARARARRLPPFAAYADPMIDLLAVESRNSTFLIRLASEADLAINLPWAEFLSRRAVEFDPDNPEVVFKLARVLRTTGCTEEALQHFERYRQLVPGDPQIGAHIGSCLSDLGRFSAAEPLLRQAAASLDDALSHYNLGLLLATTGRLEAAVGEYRTALERDPNDVNARVNLAAALVRTGRMAEARRELRRVLILEPDNALAQNNIKVLEGFADAP